MFDERFFEYDLYDPEYHLKTVSGIIFRPKKLSEEELKKYNEYLDLQEKYKKEKKKYNKMFSIPNNAVITDSLYESYPPNLNITPKA